MDKKDIIYIVIAFCVILIVALIIKPMITGKSANTSVPVSSVPQQISQVTTPYNTAVPVIITPTPTPIPTWDKTVKTVGFVDPGSYGISMNQSFPGGTRIAEILPNTNMTVYYAICGTYSGTTQVTNIPFPYWELWYTADPTVKMGGTNKFSSSTVTAGPGSKISISGISGSYSITYPALSIQVMDADDPNRVVRIVTPPGGIDSSLWTGSSSASSESRFMNMTAKYSSAIEKTSVVKTDPRPWKEKFFEGQKNYYFIINAHSLNFYKLEIRVPERYIGIY